MVSINISPSGSLFWLLREKFRTTSLQIGFLRLVKEQRPTLLLCSVHVSYPGTVCSFAGDWLGHVLITALGQPLPMQCPSQETTPNQPEPFFRKLRGKNRGGQALNQANMGISGRIMQWKPLKGVLSSKEKTYI